MTKQYQMYVHMMSLLALAGYQVGDHIELVQEVPAELSLVVPEGGLRQALLNLVLNSANAIGDAEGCIRIAATAGQGTVRISVIDDGPGFSDQALSAGLRAFASYQTGGTGLGLAAVRRFAVDLGGSISLENGEEGGAVVTLSLPSGADEDKR